MENARPLHNLPLRFEELERFLNRLADLQKRWPASKPEVDSLFIRSDKSAVDVAQANFQEILDSLFDATLQGCSGGSTRMGR